MEVDEEEYFAKPMNCPFHIQIYKSRIRSYRDLPIRFAEWGTVYRYERAGVLHGLLRVRGFTQDDAHIFCRPDQMAEEIDRDAQVLPAHPAALWHDRIPCLPDHPQPGEIRRARCRIGKPPPKPCARLWNGPGSGTILMKAGRRSMVPRST